MARGGAFISRRGPGEGSVSPRGVNGVLKPATDLNLREEKRVRLTIEPIENPCGDRDEAVARLKAGIGGMQFFSKGPLPTREDNHDRD